MLLLNLSLSAYSRVPPKGEKFLSIHLISQSVGKENEVYPNAPIKGTCAYIEYKRSNPMNETYYKGFDDGYCYSHLFYVYIKSFSRQIKVLHCQFKP